MSNEQQFRNSVILNLSGGILYDTTNRDELVTDEVIISHLIPCLGKPFNILVYRQRPDEPWNLFNQFTHEHPAQIGDWFFRSIECGTLYSTLFATRPGQPRDPERFYFRNDLEIRGTPKWGEYIRMAVTCDGRILAAEAA